MFGIIRKLISRINPPKSAPKITAVVCRYCGYEPPMVRIPSDGRCPKCRRCSWERYYHK